MEASEAPALVRLPPPAQLGPPLPLTGARQSLAAVSNAFAQNVFSGLPSSSPVLLSHIPKELGADNKQGSPSAVSPASPSSWVLYNNSQPDNKRRKVARTQFTEEQKQTLNHYFAQRNHMKNYKAQEIKEIERETNLTEHQIRIYFQNKRARTKSKSAQPASPPQRVSSPAASPSQLQPQVPQPARSSPRIVIPQQTRSVLKRKEPSPAPPSPPQVPIGSRSSAFSVSHLRDAPGVQAAPNSLDSLLSPTCLAHSVEARDPPPQVQLTTLAMIDSIATRMSFPAADAAQAKELMCGVFDGQHVPASIQEDPFGPTIIAACCLHIARRQNLRPTPVAAFEEALALPSRLLHDLVQRIITHMRLVLNDVDATQFVANALSQLDLGDKAVEVRLTAMTILDAARRSEQPSIQRNPAALGAAAILIATKRARLSPELSYANVSVVLKVCQWSVRSKEDELQKLLRFA